MNLKKLTIAALLIALGTVAASTIVFPFAGARLFPVQHAINVVAAVLLGPLYSVLTAFGISFLRNLLGTGSLLAFPGSMIGAFLAAWVYQKTHCKLKAVLGEVLGTGVLGAAMAFPVARFLLGRDVAAYAFVIPFILSSLAGSVVAYVVVASLSDRLLTQMGLRGKA
ncbi:MAG: hypothetical protein DDT35_01213 [Firmicutes bacterium]|nr:hypothetical protein [Bacillota bacterium]